MKNVKNNIYFNLPVMMIIVCHVIVNLSRVRVSVFDV